MGAPTTFAITLVLGAAVLHALWNAMVKGASDRTLSLGLINGGHCILGAIMVMVYLPPVAESWKFIAASTVIHFFYYWFLLVAYRFGDLSQVYPIARGVAPLMVALGAQVFANEYLPLTAWIGIVLISLGIGTLFLERRNGKIHTMAIVAALLTGVAIASYSIIDGLGVRVSQSPFGYIGWLFLLEGISTFVLLSRCDTPLSAVRTKTFVIGLAGGLISGTAYGLAIYAKSLTTLGTVSAIRESSVIIAALIGVIWFGERPWQLRLVSAAIVVCGVVLLSTAG